MQKLFTDAYLFVRMKPMDTTALITTLSSPLAHHAYCLAGLHDAVQAIVDTVCVRLSIPASELWQPLELPLTIADVRSLKKWAAQSPQNGVHKMAHIPLAGVHHEAINALLKIIEEPPPYLRIIISVHTLQELIPTIRSRCISVALQSDMTADAKKDISLPLDAREMLNQFVVLPDTLKEVKAIEKIHEWLTQLEPQVREGNSLAQTHALLDLARDASSNVNERTLLENAFLIRYSKSL